MLTYSYCVVLGSGTLSFGGGEMRKALKSASVKGVWLIQKFWLPTRVGSRQILLTESDRTFSSQSN